MSEFMKPQFALGVIGGGVAVEMALPALREFGSVAISYKDSPYKEKLSGFRYFDDPNEILQRDKIGCLYVAVPVNLHREYLLKAITSKIPILIEKPLCLNLIQCAEIASMAPENVSVAFRKRFSPMATKIRELRKANYGSVCQIEYIWLAPHPGADHWKLNREIAGGGVIMDIGSHILDFFEHCVGRIQEMELQHVEFDSKFLTESFVRFTCTFEDGSRGRVLIGWAETESIQKLEYRENNESVSWIKHGGDTLSHLTWMNRKSSQTVDCERSEDYFPMFDEFKAFSTGEENSAPSFKDGVRNMVLMTELYDAILQSA